MLVSLVATLTSRAEGPLSQSVALMSLSSQSVPFLACSVHFAPQGGRRNRQYLGQSTDEVKYSTKVSVMGDVIGSSLYQDYECLSVIG